MARHDSRRPASAQQLVHLSNATAVCVTRISSVRLGLRSIINYHERLLQDCAFATVTMAMKSASAS
jgi:hypothetical protein